MIEAVYLHRKFEHAPPILVVKVEGYLPHPFPPPWTGGPDLIIADPPPLVGVNEYFWVRIIYSDLLPLDPPIGYYDGNLKNGAYEIMFPDGTHEGKHIEIDFGPRHRREERIYGPYKCEATGIVGLHLEGTIEHTYAPPAPPFWWGTRKYDFDLSFNLCQISLEAPPPPEETEEQQPGEGAGTQAALQALMFVPLLFIPIMMLAREERK